MQQSITFFKEQISFRILIASISSSISILMGGFGSGFPSPVANELLKLHIVDSTTFSIFSASFLLSFSVFAIFAAPLSKMLGKKFILVIFSAIGGLGWVCIALSNSFFILLIGRIITGASVGVTNPLVSIYISELSQKSTRGFFCAFTNVFLHLGVLSSYIIGAFVSFKWLAIVGAALSLLQSLLMCFQPYSPTWLLTVKWKGKAVKTLKKIRTTGHNVEEECKIIETILLADQEMKETVLGRIKLLCKGYHMKALAVGLMVSAGYMITGNNLFHPYTSQIIGETSLLSINVLSIAVPSSALLGAIVSTLTIDRLGRRPLILISSCAVIVCFISLSVYHFIRAHLFNCGDLSTKSCSTMSPSFSGACHYLSLWPLISLAAVQFSISLGWGSVFYVLIGELFPIKIKETSASFMLITINTLSALSIIVFPFVVQLIGLGFTFIFLSVANLIFGMLALLFVPETKAKSVEERENIFKNQCIFINCLKNKQIHP